jgi:dsRNA-specific ribonuclease
VRTDAESVAALQTLANAVKSKEHCARIAKMFRLDQWVKISERQNYIGVQPTTLKNVVAALIGAVWMDSSCNYRAVLKVMTQMTLVEGVLHITDVR